MDSLKAALNAELFAGNTVGTLCTFITLVFITLLVGRGLRWLLQTKLKQLADKSKNQFDDIILDALDKPLQRIVLAGGLVLSFHTLVMPEELDQTIRNIGTVVVIVFVAWAATRLLDGLRTHIIDPWVLASETKLDDQIVPIMDKTLKVAIWSFTVLICFSNLGYDIVSLLTGLGIGGLAVAMAAQDTLSNVFGSVTIFADQPFQVDDLISVGEFTGVVSSVGLRTCRIRTFEETMVTIPNAHVVAQPVVNRSFEHEAWRQSAVIGLEYSTPAKEMRRAIEALNAIFDKHPTIGNHGARFMNFGDSAVEIAYAYWVLTRDPDVFLDVVSEVNLQIKETFDKEGWGMAFPSVSIYPAEPAKVMVQQPGGTEAQSAVN